MQLMSLRKHNITAKSSFGWWASYLSDNPNKITFFKFGNIIPLINSKEQRNRLDELIYG